MGVTGAEFRGAIGCFATGVAVVTTRQDDGRPCGLTANAVTSVSLEPPLVLVCVDKTAESHPHFGSTGIFAVNVLTEAQRDVSARFAMSGGDKFAGLPFHWGATGAPVLNQHLACVECRIVAAHDGGDHTIYVGRVEVAASRGGRPLLYFRGAYGSLGDSRESSNVPKMNKS